MKTYTTTILLSVLVVAASIAWLHNLAMEHSWYWVYWWFDVPMHVLGGFLIGLIVVFFLGRFSSVPLRGARQAALIVGLALVVGIMWELFEWWAGVFVIHEPFPDSIHDLFADVAGALTAYVYAVGVQHILVRKNK